MTDPVKSYMAEADPEFKRGGGPIEKYKICC